MVVKTKTLPMSFSSSDSDSESEPEYVATKSRLHQRKRKNKAKGQRTEVKQVGEVVTVTDLLSNQIGFAADKASLMNIDSVNVLHNLNPPINT